MKARFVDARCRCIGEVTPHEVIAPSSGGSDDPVELECSICGCIEEALVVSESHRSWLLSHS